MKQNRGELERAHYNGLTTADKGALEKIKDEGWNWIARDKADAVDYHNGWIAVSKNEPQWSMWGYDHNGDYKWIGKSETLPFVLPDSKVNIDLALAQIAEMESKPIDESATDDIVLAEVYSLREKLKIAADIIHKLDPNYDVTEFLHQVGSADYDQREEDLAPLTWNERINQMTVEEKARYLCNYVGQCVNERGTPPFKPCDKMYVLDTPKDGQYRDCLKCWEGYLNSAAEVGK